VGGTGKHDRIELVTDLTNCCGAKKLRAEAAGLGALPIPSRIDPPSEVDISGNEPVAESALQLTGSTCELIFGDHLGGGIAECVRR
jgi:hypothetical protein